jgi:RNA polymerase sigma factor (sigma-70 family)
MGSQAEDPPTNVPLEQWRSGDGDAFRVLFERCTLKLQQRIRAHRAWPLVAPHCEVDDLLQEVWLRALAAAKATFEYRGHGSLQAFLQPIADGVVTDQARRITAHKRGDGAVQALATNFDAPDVAGPGRAAPETPTGIARKNELTVLARTHLNEIEFRAWELVDMQGLSSLEAARILECTDSSVRGSLKRARAKLATLLDEEPNAAPPSDD